MKKYLILLILSLLISSCFASESGTNRIWGHEIIEIEEALKNKNYDFFDSIQWHWLYRNGQLGDIKAVHKGGAYYFSFILAEMGEPEWQIRFLEEELLNGSFPEEAEKKLYEILSHSGQWDRLSKFLGQAYRSNRLSETGEIHYIESLFENGQQGKALDVAGGKLVSLAASKSYIHKGRNLRSEVFLRFLYNDATPSDVAELGSYLRRDGSNASLDYNSALYIDIMTSFIKGDRNSLREKLNEFHVSPSMAEVYPNLVYQLRGPVLMADMQGLWADRLSSYKTFGSLFVAGRLYLSERNFDKAADMFRKAYTYSGSSYEQDRSRWYLMNLFSSNADILAQFVEEFAEGWNDPFYFSDVLEKLLNQIVSDSRWEILERIYPLILEYADNETSAAYSWVFYNLPGFSSEEIALELLKAPHFSFYNIMGHALTGRELKFSVVDTVEDSPSEADDFIKGFYLFSLDPQALEMSSGLENQLSNPLLRQLARQAADSGNYLKSIQLAAYLDPDEEGVFSREDLKLKYPYVYEDMILRYSDEYDFPAEILAGIIRTESAYTHDIVSHAGAVGLSQLMPETAADQARKLKIEDPDLTDPDTNIRIGSSYVRWILDRPWNDNLSQMLIAYNGGGGNLRRWKRMYPLFSDELFVEAIPYKETRNYVKKVITSSVVYGFIYGEESPENVIGKIYPDFFKLLEK